MPQRIPGLDGELLEGLYGSQNPSEILKFYTGVGTSAEMIAFSKSRPRASMRIVDVQSKRDNGIVVVIPTADSKSSLAREASRIFKPIDIILVESQGKYFNYARSMNFGIDSALRKDPEWIIISNDDVFEIDPIDSFVAELRQEKDSEMVMAAADTLGRYHHSMDSMVFANNLNPATMALDVLSWKSYFFQVIKVLHRFGVKFRADNLPPTQTRAPLVDSFFRGLASRSVCVERFCTFGDFGAFRSSLLRRFQFDEFFINGGEDRDLAIRLKLAKVAIKKSNFRLGSMVGKTLGSHIQRSLRDLLNCVLLDRKIREYFPELNDE